MSIKSFEPLVNKERSAYRYLHKVVWKNYRIFCTNCRSKKVYRIRRRHYRCKKCHYEFTDFSGRWFGQAKISPKNWLWLIKLFELDVSALKASRQIGLSYPTVLKTYAIIRKSIIANSQDRELLMSGEVELDESYFGGRRKGKRGRGAYNKVPVFGILERDGIARVEVVKDVTAESLLNLTVRTVRRGAIVYTDKFRGYDSLIFCGYRHLKVDHSKKFVNGKVYINGLEGFWSYAKERLIKFHGVSKQKFALYLKEMEFRYNNRKNNLFDLLVQNLSKLVENLL